MTLVSDLGTGLFRFVPKRMMKRNLTFYCTVDGTKAINSIFYFKENYYENKQIIT
jgi:hypothetical protein